MREILSDHVTLTVIHTESNMEKLKLSHTILYSKGWYAKSKETWKDLVKTLVADGLITLSNEGEVAAYMLNYISSNYEVIKKEINCLYV